MSSKRKFKRDYIILEAKDMNFRYKERILPKAFAKIEVNDEKSVVALYVENLKYMKDGYRVVAIRSDYETIDLGKITLNEQGKGEFVLNLEDKDAEIKGIALLYEKTVPLIGFKGNKIENYEEILFMGDEDDYIETDDEVDEYEEIEYIEVEDDEDGDYEEYEEIEYIEVEEDDNLDGYGDTDDEYEFDESVDGDIDYDNVENKYHEYQNINDDNGLEYNRTNRIPRQNKTIKEKVKQYRSPINKAYQGINYQDDINETQQERNTRPQGTLLMPRQIKKGLKYFREVKPFVEDYVDNTRWWKIDITPATLCGYTMPYLGYVNSLNYTMYSDAIMQSYKYRHYLFGVQYDEYNKRKNYIYAVPGKKDEQPDKGHTGFTTYQPCDNRGNSLGYWLCYIDSRTRNILK
ncbi:MAG: hypothetical protein E6X43_00030 [Peptostreptococcaceae bacterium]|nr:hypothetical protein [Peptostreptococcaceae bacterium]